jgi:hypothetical protein
MLNRKLYAVDTLVLETKTKVAAYAPTSAIPPAWNNYTTTSLSASVEDRDQVFWDTTASTCTAILPAAPVIGSIVRLIDFKGTWGTNKLTVDRNGNKIQGVSDDLDLTIPWDCCTLVFDGVDNWHLLYS